MKFRFVIATLILLTASLGGQREAFASEQDAKASGSDNHSGDTHSTETHTPETKSPDSKSEDSHDGNNGEGSSASPTSSSSGSASLGTLPAGSVETGLILSSRTGLGAISRTPILDPQQTKVAIQQGQAASMNLLLTYLNQNYPGEVLDVKLHPVETGLVYEVRYLSNIVFLHTVYLDAKTLKNK